MRTPTKSEEWREYRAGYEVSNFGRVRNPNGEIMKPYRNTSQSYRQISLFENGKRVERPFVHIMVAKCFVPNPDNLPQVHHIDENPYNCSADNLKWVSPKQHASERSAERKQLNHKRRILDIAQIDPNTNTIIRIWSRRKLKQSDEHLLGYVLRCCNDTKGTYHGFRWCYYERNPQQNLFT